MKKINMKKALSENNLDYALNRKREIDDTKNSHPKNDISHSKGVVPKKDRNSNNDNTNQNKQLSILFNE